VCMSASSARLLWGVSTAWFPLLDPMTPVTQAVFRMTVCGSVRSMRCMLLLHCCRFIFVVEGEVQVKAGSKSIKLPTNHWAYFGPTVDSK
jgi:glyoxylate utilization-related uncharacterized protein